MRAKVESQHPSFRGWKDERTVYSMYHDFSPFAVPGTSNWMSAAAHVYPGGSFGNGAAMRVAPIGLLLWNNRARLKEVAHQASLITHSHILGKEGAALQASAVALAVAEEPDKPINLQSFIISPSPRLYYRRCLPYQNN